MNVHSNINIGRNIPKWKNPNVHELVNGQTERGLFMQWSTIPAINSNPVLIHAPIQISLKNVVLNERGHTKHHILYDSVT